MNTEDRPSSTHLKLVTGFAVVATIAGLGGYVCQEASTPAVTEMLLIKADSSPAKHRLAEPGGVCVSD